MVGAALLPEETADISWADAVAYGIDHGEMIRVKSRRGEVVVKANITDRMPKGMVWMAFHFPGKLCELVDQPRL